MVLKSLTRRSNTKQLLEYLFDPKKNENIKPVLKHNLRARSIKGWTKEFDDNEALRLRRRKDNIKIYHTILSFSTKDKEHITPNLLKNISKKYVELRGKDNMFLVASHNDREHLHLHIVMPGTKYKTAVSNRISKKEFHKLKLEMDSYQREKYPNLIHSLPEHGKSLKNKLTEKEQHLQLQEGKLSQKQQLLETMNLVHGKAKSLEDFLTQMKSEGYEAYNRGGKLYGLEDADGRHYRFKTLDFSNKLEHFDKQAAYEEKELEDLRDLRESKSIDRDQESEREVDESDGDQSEENDEQEEL